MEKHSNALTKWVTDSVQRIEDFEMFSNFVTLAHVPFFFFFFLFLFLFFFHFFFFPFSFSFFSNFFDQRSYEIGDYFSASALVEVFFFFFPSTHFSLFEITDNFSTTKKKKKQGLETEPIQILQSSWARSTYSHATARFLYYQSPIYQLFSPHLRMIGLFFFFLFFFFFFFFFVFSFFFFFFFLFSFFFFLFSFFFFLFLFSFSFIQFSVLFPQPDRPKSRQIEKKQKRILRDTWTLFEKLKGCTETLRTSTVASRLYQISKDFYVNPIQNRNIKKIVEEKSVDVGIVQELVGGPLKALHELTVFCLFERRQSFQRLEEQLVGQLKGCFFLFFKLFFFFLMFFFFFGIWIFFCFCIFLCFDFFLFYFLNVFAVFFYFFWKRKKLFFGS